MITIYDRRCSMTLSPGETAPTSLPADTVWVDLYNETEEEAALVEHLTRRRLPNRHRLAEVETSSRLSDEGDALVMSSPIIYRDGASLLTTPVGFILTSDLLITLRQEELRSFSDFIHEVKSHEAEPLDSGSAAWLGLIESIVDRVADGMEAVGADLEKVSRRIFKSSVEPAKSKPTNVEAKLRETLETVGRSGDTTGYVRDSLLGLGRMAGYVHANADKYLKERTGKRLDSIRQDIASLNDYETHLTNKVQFLLDSTLGLINIEQNRTFKLLTVASVIGIPPTFVVGLYGMNFKTMPEYDWAWGYEWGLFLVVLSIIIPVGLLRWKGWV